MSVIKVDTISNKDGTSGPILSGLTTVGIITSNLSIGSTTGYFEEVVAGVITSVTSIGVVNVYSSGSFIGDGSSITGINASNINNGTLNNARLSSTVNVTNLESGQLNVSGVSTLSGAIDANSTANFQGNVTLQSDLILGDNDEIQLGGLSGGDLLITHLSSTNNSLIRNRNTSGSFLIDTAPEVAIEIRNSSGGEKMGVFTPNGAVDLYYDNSKKFETASTGVVITGIATATTFSGNLTGNVTGNADTATSATSATTATNATNITLADESSDTTCFPVFATAATGNRAPKTDSDRLTYNASSGLLVATTHQSTNMIADSTMRVGSATTSNSLYVVGNSASNIHDLGTESSSFALDFSTGNNFAFTIGGNITLNNPTGITTGQSGIIEITQDGTGSRTMAFQSHWNFPDGTAPTITAGAGTTSVLAYFVKDADMIITASLLALG